MPVEIDGKTFEDHDSAVAHLKKSKPDIKDPDAYVATVERKQREGSMRTMILGANIGILKIKTAAAIQQSKNVPTKQDAVKWWKESLGDNFSKKQHADDPNRLNDAESVEFAKKPIEQFTPADYERIFLDYAFRHQDCDTTKLLGYNIHANAQIWWDGFKVTQKQHIIDPHQLFTWSLDMCKTSYKNLDRDQKKMVDKLFEDRHTEEGHSKSASAFVDALKKTKDRQFTCSTCGDTFDESQKTAHMDTHKIGRTAKDTKYTGAEVGYCEGPTDFKCKNCVWFIKPNVCNYDNVGLTRKVDPDEGCCNEFSDKTGNTVYDKADESVSQYAKLVTGSMVDEYTNQSGKYVAYFLLRGDMVNLKDWGVTAESIPQRIGSFKGMPFTITSSKFFPTSPYGITYDHPSTEHFPKLGIAKAGSYNPNDMMLQGEFQEHFRVGTIVDTPKKGKDYIAIIKIDPKFASYQMPPLVSPAIFKLNPREPDGQISTWTGMHLAGLDEKPAYGNIAIYHGSCDGPGSVCIKQLSAKMTGYHMGISSCQKKAAASMLEAKIINLRTNLLLSKLK